MELTHFDSQLIGNIYQASYDSNHWVTVLEGIAKLTNSDSAVIGYQDGEIYQASIMHSYNINSDKLKKYNEEGVDPHFKLFADAVPLGEATSAQKVVPDRQQLEDIYGKVFINNIVGMDMYYIGGVVLFNDENRKIAIGIQRSKDCGTWHDDELKKLTLISPHLQRALHIHREFTRLRIREQSLRAGLNKLLVGLIIFDSSMQTIYLNPIAKSILKSHPAIYLKNNRICATTHEDTQKIRKALILSLNANKESDPLEYSTALGFHHSESKTPLPILITPLYSISTLEEKMKLDNQVAMIISDPEKNQPIVPEALCTAYKLTPSEAKVAIALTNGLSIDEVAMLHGNQPSTIKSQLKAIKSKLGISRQSELVKMLLTGPFRVNF